MRTKVIAFLALIGVVLLAIGGCDLVSSWLGAAAGDYLPLAVGASWSYAATVEYYDDPAITDFDTTQEFGVTLYVAGTRTIGDVETYEMKVRDFTTDVPDIDPVEMNDMLAGFSVFVAATDDGIEVFGVDVNQSDSYDPGGEGWASSFVMSGTFNQGVAILPPFIFQGATAEVAFTMEDTYTDYLAGAVNYTSVDTADVSAEVVVTTDGDKREILGKNYRGAQLTSVVTVETTGATTYPNDPPSGSSWTDTVTSSGDLFIAQKIGFASLSLTWDWGDSIDNEGMPHTMNLDLTGTTVDD